MATISVEPMTALGSMPRVTVNGYQFIEMTVMSGTGDLPDYKIETGIGTSAVIVDSWTPEHGTEDLDHMHSFVVNCHAATTSAEDEFIFEGGGDYTAGGTFTQAVEFDHGVQLETISVLVDFEDYNVGPLAAVGQPEEWMWLGGTYNQAAWRWQVVADTDPESWDGQHITMYQESGTQFTGFIGGGTYASGTFSCQVYLDSQYGASPFGLCVNLTGSSTALRGHAITMDTSQWLTLKRINNATSWTGIGSVYGGVNLEDTVYNLKIQVTTDGSTSWYYAKKWLDGSAEPPSFSYVGADTIYNGAGWVGLGTSGSPAYARFRVDNLTIEPEPVVHWDEGDWTSDPIDMTAIGNYSYGLIEWDETLPTDTSATVSIRWRDTWFPCTNGGQIPGIELGEAMTAGSSKDSMEIKIELSTTDENETPLVENVHFYHVPLAHEVLEIEIDGSVSCVEADRSLNVWGIRQVIAGVNDEAWDDVWMQTYQRYQLQRLGESFLVKLIYNGSDIDEIVVTTSRDYWSEAFPLNMAEFSMNPIKYASAPVEARWVLLPKWAPMDHVYEWILIDRTLAIHADAYFLVGHVQIDDHAGSLLIAHREVKDFAGSLLVNGFKLNDFRGEFLVQGYRRDDHAGMVMPAIKVLEDYAGQIIVAQEVVRDFSGMILVYGVNRDGSIFLNIVDDATYDKLVAEGIVFS